MVTCQVERAWERQPAGMVESFRDRMPAEFSTFWAVAFTS